MSVTLDMMEYSSDAAAQAAYVSSDAGNTAHYPPAHSDTYVKVSSKYSTNFWPYYATDPALSLSGAWELKAWVSANGSYTNQRFNIDIGSAMIIARIYLENGQSGGITQYGIKDFILQGSNDSRALAQTNYASDTYWTDVETGLQARQGTKDGTDPQYFTIDSSIPYKYYSLKIDNQWSGANYMSIRHVELQGPNLQSYSEDTIKTQGSYSLKGVALITDSLNDTLTRTIA